MSVGISSSWFSLVSMMMTMFNNIQHRIGYCIETICLVATFSSDDEVLTFTRCRSYNSTARALNQINTRNDIVSNNLQQLLKVKSTRNGKRKT